jgi:predicted dienelactone hydrolase
MINIIWTKTTDLTKIIFMIIALTVLSSSSVHAVKTIASDGPYGVGVMIERVEFEGRETRIIVWYPAEGTDGEGYKFESGVRGAAVLDAAVNRAAAPYPLILFSHGIGGAADQSVYYCQNLASAGYLVVSMDHMDKDTVTRVLTPNALYRMLKKMPNTPDEAFGLTMFMTLYRDYFNGIDFDLSYRPREASFAIDYALEINQHDGSPLKSMIDPERIGATGHSLGGFTALLIGGVPMKCDHPEDLGRECDMMNQDPLDLEFPCCIDFVRNMDPYDFRDTRVKAILPLAPAVLVPHLADAAGEIEVPIMIITGNAVKLEAPFPTIKTLYDNAGPPKYLVRVKKADHMTIAEGYPMMTIPITRWSLPGFRKNYQDKARVYKDYSRAFFDLYLKGDDSGSRILDEPASEFAELWGER